MLKSDEIRILHMLEAASEALALSSGKTIEEIKNDRALGLALLKLVEIIGEAAVKISDEIKNENNDIPWRAIIAMRNRLIHAYFDIDIKLVWGAIKEDLPPLIAKLEKIIKKK